MVGANSVDVLEAKFKLIKPQKGTKSTRIFFCVFCAFLWLILLCGGAAAQSFLDDLQQRSFRYFWEQADPQTGLVPDRARMDGSPLPPVIRMSPALLPPVLV